MRLTRDTVAFSGHQTVMSVLTALLSVSLFMGASTTPVPYAHAVTLFHAAEFDFYVQRGNARFFLDEHYGLPTAIPNASEIPAYNDSDAQGVASALDREIRRVSLEDFVLGDLALDVPAPEHTLRLLDLDQSLASTLSTGNANLDAFNNELLLAWTATTMDPAVVDSFPRIPDVDPSQREKLLPRMPRPGRTANPFQRRKSSFFLTPTNDPVKVVVEVDSVRNLVTIREVVNGRDVRIPITMTTEEYIKRRMEYERDARTLRHANTYEEKGPQTLEDVMRDLTEFDIPIPPNPLMSIFGDRSRISLRINGQVDINAGFRIESSDQQSVFLRPTQFSPNFRQRVQINLNGLIGDKLSIKADWSTDRTFDYENELKIKYTGYEDEIIQSIEAGNVTLQTPSTLIQGSGALFGLKAEFQFGPLRITTIASQQKGSSATKVITGGSEESAFIRRAYDYSDSHFFIDEAYREDVDSPGDGPPNVYEAYYNYQAYGSTSPIKLDPAIEIQTIEVWVSRPSSAGAVPNPEEREGVAFIDFDSIGSVQPASSGNPYTSQYVNLLDPNQSVSPVSGEIEVGKFIRWEENKDFYLNPVTGILTLNQNIQEDQVVAVAYRVRGSDETSATDLIYGTFSTDQRFTGNTYPDPGGSGELRPARLILKLVKPRNLVPTMQQAWNQKVRSIYSLNMRNITADDIAELKIVYNEGGKPEETQLLGMQLLRMFGLDYGSGVSSVPDNKIDFLPGITVDPVRGELIFPTLRPWDTGMVTIFSKLSGDPGSAAQLQQYTFPTVYDDTKTEARKKIDRDKIYITGRTRGSSSSTFQLGFNIVPGSVQVILNGTPLQAGVDYKVDENVGSIMVMKPEALEPGADLVINYEKQDLFSFASKTLVGARGDLDLGEETHLGFTYLSLSQQTLSDKVRIGDEPVSNTMFGIDGRTTLDMPIITEALNTLPFLSTKEKSTFTAQGEFAMVMPGEDSKTSPIPSDGGKGIAYLDDFEGSRIFIPLQTAYNVWKIGSVPALMPFYDPVDSDTTAVAQMNHKRAKLNWYNIPISGSQSEAVRVTDIWPDRQAAREDQRVTVLDFDFYPRRRGPYNYRPTVGEGDGTQNWGGVMRYLPINANNLTEGNYNFLEIWMKVDDARTGTMLIDLGKISEDVIPDGRLQTEDAVVYGFNGRDGILSEDEDVGLDMLTDAEEQIAYAAEIAANLIDADDPSGDNYAGAPNWDNFNGSQGNLNSFNGQFPDTEDLNKNSILDLTNEYFQYRVDLDSATFNPSPGSGLPRNKYVVGGGSNGWYQFRIPLSDFDSQIGAPTLTNVEFIRVSFTGVNGDQSAEPFRVRMAEFNFVGNQWLETYPDDPKFGVTVVNIEDNPNEYTTPPGVIRPRDRTRPDQEIYGNEQSLALVFNDISGTDSLTYTAYRVFPGQRGLDLFNYEKLKLYVHGDPSLAGTRYYFVMRFGIDDSAYYEYRQPLYPGWDARNEVDIDFKTLAALKESETFDPVTNSTPYVDVGGGSEATFRVQGTPDLVNVRFMAVGVQNDSANNDISGQVWINELRVVAPKLDIGYAYGGSMSLRIADVADVNASMNYTDPNFHGLSERFSATRAWINNWSISSTLHLQKAFPESWKGTQMRVTYSHTENVSKPKLMPGQPDVEVETVVAAVRNNALREGKSLREAELLALNARVETQTVRITDSWSIPTLQFKAPGDHWLVTDVFNRLTFGYNYNTSRYRDPTISILKRWEWNFTMGYGYEFGRDFHIQPFTRIFDGVPILEDFIDAKWFYFPTRIGLNAALRRSRTEEHKRDAGTFLPFTREFLHQRAAQLSFVLSEGSLLNIDGSYSTALQTSLLGLEVRYLRDSQGRLVIDAEGNPQEVQRQSSAIFSDIFFGRGGLYFGDPLRYDQSFVLNSRPWIPSIFNLDRFADLSLGYTVNYHWQTNLQQRELGRSAGFNSNSNITMNFKLKAFTDPWFDAAGGPGDAQDKGGPPGRRGASQQEKTPGETPEELAEREAAEKRRASYDPERDREALIESMNRDFEKLPEEERTNPVKIQEFEALMQHRMDSLEQHIRTIIDPDMDQDAGSGGFKIDIAQALSDFAYYAIKIPLLDYDNINFSFSQTSASQVSGVVGQTGFSTFWTTAPFSAGSNIGLGPSRLYQLGLVSDPNPESGELTTTGNFPFFGISNYQRGLRAPNPAGNYVDNYTQSSAFNTKTNRPLWEGANLDLSWSVRWSMNKNYQISTDEVGRQRITSTTSTGQIERSYLAFPDFLFFSAFNTNIESVNERFQELKADASDQRTDSEKLAEAFERGFEALPWLSDVLGSFMPRVNWGIRWEGLEKISFLEGAADRISLEHRYNSTLASNYRHSADDGSRLTESKRVESGFSPLLGATLGWDKIWDGTMSLTARWNKSVGFNLITASSNIQQESRDEVTMMANFRKNGFEMPFLGLTLKNDVEFSLAFSYSTNRQRTFEISNLSGEGQPREGTIQYSIEPRVRYSISQRVNASIFYRYQRTKPDSEGGSSIPGTTIHEAGLELKITISG